MSKDIKLVELQETELDKASGGLLWDPDLDGLKTGALKRETRITQLPDDHGG